VSAVARTTTAFGLGLLVAVAVAAPADAHTVTGVPSTNYRSEIVAVSPPVPGVRLRLLDFGRRVELVNRTGVDVVVLGYQGEPYLRVGPGGVFENRRSPAVDLNRAQVGAPTTTSLPPRVDASAPPVWHRIAAGRTVRWRDRRTRWEGADPPAVRAAPGQGHVVAQWTLELRQGAVPVAAVGRITWTPGPSPLPWLLLGLVLAAALASVAWSRRWASLLSGAVAVLVANDAVHSFGTAAASHDTVPATLVKVLLGGFLPTLAWVAGAWAIGRLQRDQEVSRVLGLLAAGAAGIIIALYGLSDAFSLGRSQVPYVFPSVAARIAVASTLGLGAGVVAAVVVVFRRNPGLLLRPVDE
jgi:hypothetical protein